MMKKTLALLLLLVLSVLAFSSCDKKNDETVKDYTDAYAVIAFRDYGNVVVDLDYDNAPITVRNFCKLADSGFYDGLTIHRIQEGFVIQGGDPDANGQGGSANTIKGEFSENGVKNKLSHTRGVISMARSDDYNSASSQFFICLDDSCTASLDGKYAGFGMVISGMDLVDQIVTDYLAYTSGSMGMITEKADQPIIDSVKIYYSEAEVQSYLGE